MKSVVFNTQGMTHKENLIGSQHVGAVEQLRLNVLISVYTRTRRDEVSRSLAMLAH